MSSLHCVYCAGVLMKMVAIHLLMPPLLFLLTASWGLIALFDMFEVTLSLYRSLFLFVMKMKIQNFHFKHNF